MSDYVDHQMQDAPFKIELTEADWIEVLHDMRNDLGLQADGSGQTALESVGWELQDQAQVEPGDR